MKRRRQFFLLLIDLAKMIADQLGRSATGLNGQAAKEEVSALWRGGLDAGKYLWRSGREKCFSLDIPFNRTSG